MHAHTHISFPFCQELWGNTDVNDTLLNMSVVQAVFSGKDVSHNCSGGVMFIRRQGLQTTVEP